MNRLIVLLWLLFLPISIYAQDKPTIPPQVAQLGNGTTHTLDWHPAGDLIAVGGTLGLWLYDNELTELAHLPETGEIITLLWSPNGNQLATLSRSKVIQLWDITLNPYAVNLIYTLALDTEGSIRTELAWSPNSNYLAILTDNGAEIFDTVDGTSTLHIPELISSLAWSPDGTQLAGGVNLGETRGRYVGAWDVATGGEVNTYFGADEGLYWSDILWHPDGTMLVGVTSVPAALHAWDIETGELLNEVDIYGGEFGSTLKAWWSDDGQQLVTAERSVIGPPSNDWLATWDTTNWTYQRESMSVGSILQIAKKPDEQVWAILTFDGVIATFQWGDETPLHINFSHGRPSQILTWSSNDQKLAANQSNISGSINIWNFSSQQPTEPLILGMSRVFELEFFRWSSDNEILIGFLNAAHGPTAPGTTLYARVVAWNTETSDAPETLHETGGYVSLESEINDGIESFTLTGSGNPNYVWNSDFSQVASFLGNKGVHISPVTNPESQWLQIGEAQTLIHVNNAVKFVWSPDDTMLAILRLDQDGETTIWIFDVQTGERINLVSPFMTHFDTMIWSPDSTMFAVTGHRAITASQTTEYRLHVVTVDSQFDIAPTTFKIVQFDTRPELTWHPESQIIAVAQPDGIGVYEIGNEDSPLALIPNIEVLGLAWSNDGTLLAGGHRDGTVRIWHLANISD